MNQLKGISMLCAALPTDVRLGVAIVGLLGLRPARQHRHGCVPCLVFTSRYNAGHGLQATGLSGHPMESPLQ